MATRIKISMSSSGRLTIPVDTRRALGITGETEFEVEVVDHGIVLRPPSPHSGDDRWAYAPNHAKLLRRALKESESGVVQALSETDLRMLAPID